MITYNDMHDVLTDEEWESLQAVVTKNSEIRLKKPQIMPNGSAALLNGRRLRNKHDYWNAVYKRLQVVS
jgi:hypothetical protein